MRPFSLVVVGSSWGGVDALEQLLSKLPPTIDVAIAIAQHRAEEEPDLLSAILQRHTKLKVQDACDKTKYRRGNVYLAPAGYHLLVEGDGFALSIDGPVNFARPSIDVLFESAAEVLGPRAIGVVLTGSNRDGAVGLAAIRRNGGVALVQDPSKAERAEMPRAALEAADAEKLSLGRLASRLVELCGERKQPTSAS